MFGLIVRWSTIGLHFATLINISIAASNSSTRDNDLEIQTYHDAINPLIFDNHFADRDRLEAWRNVDYHLITGKIADAAYAYQGTVKQWLFQGHTPMPYAIARQRTRPKSLARIAEKATRKSVDDPTKIAFDSSFRANSDLAAFMISQPDPRAIVTTRRDMMAIATRNRPGVFLCAKKMIYPTDIIANFFIYDKADDGYITEVQINHPFAIWAHAHNSETTHKPSADKRPDVHSKFWSPDGKEQDLSFYDMMKRLIYDPTSPGTYFPVLIALGILMNDTPAPPELVKIIMPYVDQAEKARKEREGGDNPSFGTVQTS